MEAARLHRRIANRRLDDQHKATPEMVDTDRMVGVEGLDVSGMLKRDRLALSMTEAGFGDIQRQLRHKSEGHSGESTGSSSVSAVIERTETQTSRRTSDGKP